MISSCKDNQDQFNTGLVVARELAAASALYKRAVRRTLKRVGAKAALLHSVEQFLAYSQSAGLTGHSTSISPLLLAEKLKASYHQDSYIELLQLEPYIILTAKPFNRILGLPVLRSMKIGPHFLHFVPQRDACPAKISEILPYFSSERVRSTYTMLEPENPLPFGITMYCKSKNYSAGNVNRGGAYLYLPHFNISKYLTFRIECLRILYDLRVNFTSVIAERGNRKQKFLATKVSGEAELVPPGFTKVSFLPIIREKEMVTCNGTRSKKLILGPQVYSGSILLPTITCTADPYETWSSGPLITPIEANFIRLSSFRDENVVTYDCGPTEDMDYQSGIGGLPASDTPDVPSPGGDEGVFDNDEIADKMDPTEPSSAETFIGNGGAASIQQASVDVIDSLNAKMSFSNSRVSSAQRYSPPACPPGINPIYWDMLHNGTVDSSGKYTQKYYDKTGKPRSRPSKGIKEQT